VEPRWLAPDVSEPLGTWAGPIPPARGARRQSFELASRGDRVPGELWLPDPGRPPFAVVLQQGESGSLAAAEEDALPGWLAAGLAVASIDLPLHGGRASAKLGALLRAGLRDAEPEPLARDLAIEFARQAVLDLRRCLDALPRLARVDAERIAYAGSGVAAALGAHLCAQDPRLRAAVLAGAAGRLPSELDPRAALGRIAPRPLLFVDARGGRAAAAAVHAAAAEPKQVRWVDTLPPLGDPPTRAFVAGALGLPTR